jgi:hypothetical protein
MKLDVKAFAWTFGLMWGFGVFFLTWWVILFEGSTHDLLVLGHLYRGYDVSPLGSVIGLAWGLADGGLGGAFFAWLYNKLVSEKP